MAVFIFVEIFTCVLGEMISRGIRGMLKENADYNSTLNNLLATFHMTKTELLAYIQLGRGGMAGKDISEFFDRLDECTEANLIRAQWKFSGDKHKSLQVYTERTFHQRYLLVML